MEPPARIGSNWNWKITIGYGCEDVLTYRFNTDLIKFSIPGLSEPEFSLYWKFPDLDPDTLRDRKRIRSPNQQYYRDFVWVLSHLKTT
ncbi:MAG: hypothetical protein CMJ23_03590 [Phycisphaerae bacterium]|nr:hypothetical protein [Phycisphaerae bacterium]